MIAARCFGGLFTAGGSVTLGVVADLFDVNDQQYAIAFIVLSSVLGTSIGPLVGPFIAGAVKSQRKWLTALDWIFWVQLIFGFVTQMVHLLIVPETRETVLLDREAKRRRKAGKKDIYGPNELKENRFNPKEILLTWWRPFDMLAREPIVLCLSLLSGVRIKRLGQNSDRYSSLMLSSSFSPNPLRLFMQTGISLRSRMVLRLFLSTLGMLSRSFPFSQQSTASAKCAGRIPTCSRLKFAFGGFCGRHLLSPLVCLALRGLLLVQTTMSIGLLP